MYVWLYPMYTQYIHRARFVSFSCAVLSFLRTESLRDELASAKAFRSTCRKACTNITMSYHNNIVSQWITRFSAPIMSKGETSTSTGWSGGNFVSVVSPCEIQLVFFLCLANWWPTIHWAYCSMQFVFFSREIWLLIRACSPRANLVHCDHCASGCVTLRFSFAL